MQINRILFHVLFFIAAATALTACQSTASNNVKANKTGGSQNVTAGGGGATPTEAYKNLYAAVKSKNPEAVKANMSKATIELVDFQVQMFKKTPEQVLEYGMIQANGSPTLPPTRDERVKDNMGAVEVQDSDGKWQDVPFIKEDGAWRLAVGDIFRNTYVSPGQPASQPDGGTAAGVGSGANAASANQKINKTKPVKK